MSVRPPTLRENRRYILARVLPPGTPLDQKELYFAISDAVTSLWGDGMAAVITPAVVAAEGDFVFIRCRRGTERELSVALSTVTGCRDARIALRILAASGTLESLRERIRGMSPTPADSRAAGSPPESSGPTAELPGGNGAAGEPAGSVPEYQIGGIVYTACHCDGQKVDVIEKGFKNTHRLFLTRQDLEKS